jgi:hypothetical protein
MSVVCLHVVGEDGKHRILSDAETQALAALRWIIMREDDGEIRDVDGASLETGIVVEYVEIEPSAVAVLSSIHSLIKEGVL